MKLVNDILLLALIPTLILLHLVLSPYTKVEESFNLQATHDILAYGIPTENIEEYLKQNYDHFSFPGVVPRTFTGALLLASGSKLLGGTWGIQRQIIVRGVLGLFNAFALLRFRGAVGRAFGKGVANWYLLLQACQFHVIYYASRTLPNMFAFGLSTLALAAILPSSASPMVSETKSLRLSLYLMTLAGVIFRSELAILLAAETAWLYARGRLSIARDIYPAGLGGALVGLLVTIPVDSFFWLKFPLWPEWVGFYYNAIEGKSSDWGTSPWWYYFVQALPRLLVNPFSWQVCIPLAIGLPATRPATIHILVPIIAFVGIYSFQPHKELRFVMYAIPSLTAVAALGAHWIWTRRDKSLVYRVLSLSLIASTLASFGASSGMLAISRLNYPGAEALDALHSIAHGSKKVVSVHMDTLSCTTGITRFLEKPAPVSLVGAVSDSFWVYDKTEDGDTLLSPEFWEQFDYVIAEKPERVIGQWEIIRIVRGFAGISITRPTEELTEQYDSSSDPFPLQLSMWWHSFSKAMRKQVTQGWWVEAKMEPKLYLLKKEHLSTNSLHP